MAVTQNLKGTSYPSFKIHKKGPTFYQGTVAPNISAVNGDMYIQHGTGGGVWVYKRGCLCGWWRCVVRGGARTTSRRHRPHSGLSLTHSI